MKRKSNTSVLWDELWKGKGAQPPTYQTLLAEKHSVRWQRILRQAQDHFGTLKGKRVVELGAGMGTYAALFAMEGAKVTLVDYAPKALTLAKSFFKALHLSATFVLADITKLPSTIHSFDISTSCGVAEHFLNRQRNAVLDAHIHVLKSGGMTFLMVPNSANIPYRTYKAIAERGGFWPWGEEYPYSHDELIRFAKKHHIHDYGFFGDSYLWSLNYFNPLCLISKKFTWFRRFIIPQTIGTPIDEKFAYSLGLFAIKR